MPDGATLSQDDLILQATGMTRRQLEDDNGYAMLYVTPDGRVCALLPFLFTVAIIADLNPWGYGERWCYHTPQAAASAYIAWINGGCQGEPDGWTRHPSTGRRVFENHCEVYL